MLDVTSENGAVGLATPIRTGAMRASAVSHNSSTAMLIRAWKTRRHLTSGCDILMLLNKKQTKMINQDEHTKCSCKFLLNNSTGTH